MPGFYRKDHLQKHIQTHNKHFMEQNIIPMSDQELSIKEEVEDDFGDITPIITSVSGNVTDPDASMEVRIFFKLSSISKCLFFYGNHTSKVVKNK